MIAQLIIDILMDNSAGPRGTVAEKGFSALVQLSYADGTTKRILFDTGPTASSLLNNAAVLDLDLKAVDCIIFSHGHWDHVWGVTGLLPPNRKDSYLFCHPAALDKKYRVKEDGSIEVISLHQVISPERLAEMLPIRTCAEPKELFPGVYSTGEIPRLNPQEVLSESLSRIQVEGVSGPEMDQIPEDLSLLFQMADGSVVLLTGCCHAGVINTLGHSREMMGFSEIAGLIGGLHLHDAPQARLDYTIDELGKQEIRQIAACHCTGPRGIHALKNAFPDQFQDVAVGARFIYPNS